VSTQYLADGSALGVLLESYELHAPVTLDDVHAIYEDVRGRLTPGFTCTATHRGVTPLDPGPEHVEIRIRKAGDLEGERLRIGVIGVGASVPNDGGTPSRYRR
jgi:hypothetical protein